jgi:DNA-binding SARP family transcriptional activator
MDGRWNREHAKPGERQTVDQAYGRGPRARRRRSHGSSLDVFLLDGFRLYQDGARVPLPDTGQRVVALLALHPTTLSRAFVAGSLWPERPDHQAHGSLRTAVWRLHKLCSGLLTVSAHDLALASDVTVDVREFMLSAQQLLAGSSQQSVSPEADWPWSSMELLPGWYDDWVVAERERIRQLHLHALESVAEQLTNRGHFGAALEAALRVVRVDPLRESAHRLVIQVHVAEGNVWEALRQYTVYRSLLWDELQVAPSRQMQELTSHLPSS